MHHQDALDPACQNLATDRLGDQSSCALLQEVVSLGSREVFHGALYRLAVSCLNHPLNGAILLRDEPL